MAFNKQDSKQDNIKQTQEPQSPNAPLKTNLDKAKFIYTNRLSVRAFSTLERLSSQELDFIIENGRDPEPGEFDKNNVKFARELTNNFINGLEAIKEARCNEKINEPAKRFTLAQCEAISPFLNSTKAGIVGIVFFTLGIGFLIIDSCLGFDKAKALIARKSKQKQRENSNEKE